MVRCQIYDAAKLAIHVVHRRGFWMPRLHLSGDSGIRLSPALVASYAGVYELAPGRDIVVTVTGDLVFVQGLNEPKLPLFVQSETQFMSTATPTGFEFVKDAQGKVTQVIVRGNDGDRKAVRKSDALPSQRR